MVITSMYPASRIVVNPNRCIYIDILNNINIKTKTLRYVLYRCKKVSEYDQEIPQSHTADQPTAP